MALFKARGAAFEDHGELLAAGLPGRAVVLGVSMSETTTRAGNGPQQRMCAFELEVWLHNEPRFSARAVASVPEYALGQIQPGESVVAVRVAPNDHTRVAVDLSSNPPEVQVAPEPGQRSAAEVLALGDPCEVVIVQSRRLGLRSPAGIDLYAFVITVVGDDMLPYQVKVGMPVPPAGLPLLYPGSRVPAKFLRGGDPDDVVIDWDTAIVEHRWPAGANGSIARESV